MESVKRKNIPFYCDEKEFVKLMNTVNLFALLRKKVKVVLMNTVCIAKTEL